MDPLVLVSGIPATGKSAYGSTWRRIAGTTPRGRSRSWTALIGP